MGWNYLSVPKHQQCNCWSLGFHSTRCWVCDYLSMLGLKLNHVSKKVSWNQHCILLISCIQIQHNAAHLCSKSWWRHQMFRHQMETFSVLLTLCVGNSPVTGEFPTQKPGTRSFDVFFDLCLNKRLSKQSWGWWSETPSHPLWRHNNVQPISASPETDKFPGGLAPFPRFSFHFTFNDKGKTAQILNSWRYPIAHPHVRAMGCPLWCICRRVIILCRVIIWYPQCTVTTNLPISYISYKYWK